MQQKLAAQSPRMMRVQDMLIPMTLHDLGHEYDDAPAGEPLLQLVDELQDGLMDGAARRGQDHELRHGQSRGGRRCFNVATPSGL